MKRVADPLAARGEEIIQRVLDEAYLKSSQMEMQMNRWECHQEIASRGLLCPDPETQYAALSTIYELIETVGRQPHSLSRDQLQLMIERAFGDHGSIRVHDQALDLIEKMCYVGPWSISYFREADVHKMAFDHLTNEKSMNHIILSQERLSNILNVMLCNDQDTYRAIMELSYFDFILHVLGDDPSEEEEETEKKRNVSDLIWQVRALQNIISSGYFEGENLDSVINIALKYRTLDPELSSLCFAILARTIAAGFHPIAAHEDVLSSALEYLTLRVPSYGSVLEYLTNYVCFGDEATMRIITPELLSRLYDLYCNAPPSIAKETQTKILELLCNASASPMEAAMAISGNAICNHFKQILAEGEIRKKKLVIKLIIRIITKMDNLGLDFVGHFELLPEITDLLYCDDGEILEAVMHTLGWLGSYGIIRVPDKVAFIFEDSESGLCNDYILEQLYEISNSEDDRIAGLATNLIQLALHYQSRETQ